MEKTACLVSIKTAFEEEEKLYEGTFEQSEERIRVSWMQKEENKGEGDTKFLLSYRVAEKLLRLTRKGSAEMELSFREGEVRKVSCRQAMVTLISRSRLSVSCFSQRQGIRRPKSTGRSTW